MSWLEATYPYRLLLGVSFFVILGAIDFIRHRDNPKRAKEYLFLLCAALLGGLYGVVHDEITFTISPAYFILAKGLDESGTRLRVGVALLGLKASYGPGALAGAFLLIANNPRKIPQLPYARLVRAAAIPLAWAAAVAALGAAVGWAFPPPSWLEQARELLLPRYAERFVIVRAIHTGSYAGAALGTIGACVHVVRARRAAAKITPGDRGAGSPPAQI